MELPKPDVKRCFFAAGHEPPLPAMDLCWDQSAPGVAERVWHLPDGIILKGAAPQRFGVTIQRLGEDSYRVRVLWNRLSLTCDALTRRQIMASSLAAILTALGTDPWLLLNQSIEATDLLQAA